MEKIITVTKDGKVTKIIDKEGTGIIPRKGMHVGVKYQCILPNGKTVDSSDYHGGPFFFCVGQGVIPGFNVAVMSMRVGEISRFTFNSEYAFGSTGFQPKVPPNSPVIFKIDLLQAS